MGRSEFLIIERFGHTAPVDVTALAEALGLAVWEDEEMPLGISGISSTKIPRMGERPDIASQCGRRIRT